MGMFDTVLTNYRLPDVEINPDLVLRFNTGNVREFGYETKFQTKDFDCVFDQYLITSHGKLYIKEGGVNIDTKYHGFMSFCTVVHPPLGGGYLLDFHAKFTDGNLVQIGGECIRVTRNKYE